MMPHPDTTCAMAAMDHRERQARAEQDRLGARAVFHRHPSQTVARGTMRLLGAALGRVGVRLEGTRTGGAAPAPTAASLRPAR